MEISRLMPGEFKLDGMVFDSIDITLINVKANDFEDVVEAINNLAKRGPSGLPTKKIEPEPEAEEEAAERKPATIEHDETKEDETDAEQIIDALKTGKKTAKAVAYTVLGENCTREQRKDIKALCIELTSRDIIESYKNTAGATYYMLPENNEESEESD